MRWQDLRHEWLQDPEFVAALRKEFPYAQIADAIVGVRARFHLTQSQLAERIGTSQSAVARAESGKHPVEVSLLHRIAEAFNLDWHVYFDDPNTSGHRPEAAARSL